jgi:hypothetical protein
VHTVTLFIPSLFWPHSGSGPAPIVPVLQTLAGRGDAAEARCDDAQAWLCEQFNVAKQSDWPAAPVALYGAGLLPGDGFWLSADPVHLQVNRDRLILTAPGTLSVTDAEAVSLCAALNRHFSTENFRFLAPQPHRWYLNTPRPPRIHTFGLARAIGHDVDRMLPQGEDRLAWHAIFNETQMLLHGHPVNEEREQRGAVPINSLWFSGGGILPRASASFGAVIGSSALARGLSKLADIPFRTGDPDLDAVAADDVLVELRDAETAAMRLDQAGWKEALENLELRWFVPVANLLKSGRIRRIVIATVAAGRSYRWSVSRANLWRFWRHAAALDATANRAQEP